MNRIYRRFVSLFLCFCMIVQPIIFNAAYAQSAKVYEGGKSKGTLTNELNESAATVGSQQNEEIPEGQETKDTTDQEKATAESGKQEAAAQMDRVKNSPSDITGAANTANAAVNKSNNNSVGDLTSTTKDIQETLFKVGNTLIQVGQLLKTVGQIMQAVGIAMQCFPFTAPAGKVIEQIGHTLYQVGSVVEAIGNVIVKTAEVASSSDDIFGTLLGEIPNAVKQGWKKGGEEADAYSEQLNAKLSKNDTSKSQENSTTETKDSESETTKDAEQGDIADI